MKYTFNFHHCPSRQTRNTERTPCAHTTIVPKYIFQKFAASIDHLRVLGKFTTGINQAEKFYHPHNSIKRTKPTSQSCQHIQANLSGRFTPFLHGAIMPDLTNQHGTIF